MEVESKWENEAPMEPTACPSNADLLAYRLGYLHPESRDRIAEHLPACGKCRAKLARTEAADRSPNGKVVADGSIDSWASSAGDEPDQAVLEPPIEPGDLGRLEHYRILGVLGEGGMGIVYRALDTKLQRPVALKMMKARAAKMPNADKRFVREAQAMAALNDPRIVTVHEVGRFKGLPFLTMEFLEGESLDQWWLGGNRPDARKVVELARGIAEGLDVAHRKGLVHRDIKPANIWIESPSGRVKILDFGLAYSVDQNIQLTQTGMILGTPQFMSPERIDGEPVDARSDLFSLGSVLYLLATGRPPFEGESAYAVMQSLARHHPRPVQEIDPRMPRELSDLVMHLLEKRPQDRIGSAREVVERLRDIESRWTSESKGPSAAASAGRSSGRARLLWWIVGGLLILLCILLSIDLLRR